MGDPAQAKETRSSELLGALQTAIRALDAGAEDYRRTTAALQVAVERLDGRINVFSAKLEQVEKAMHAPPCRPLSQHCAALEKSRRGQMAELKAELARMTIAGERKRWDLIKLLAAAVLGAVATIVGHLVLPL